MTQINENLFLWLKGLIARLIKSLPRASENIYLFPDKVILAHLKPQTDIHVLNLITYYVYGSMCESVLQ